MKNRLIIFTIFALFITAPLYAHLEGIVLDDQGEPLVGANVYWSGTGIGTATDEQGMFEIEPIRETKLLVTSYLGFHNDTTLITNRDLIKIVLVSASELDEVVVTRRKMDVLRNRAALFDIQTIGKGEICRLACCNLSESFETNASVDVAYSDAATGMQQIRMLGLSGTYVQLLGENCPSAHGLLQPYGLEFIPGTWIESVQVSKGTSSVLNGYEAITGQINVEYLKPQKQNPIELNVFFNTDLDASIDLMGGWDIPIPNDPMLGALATGILAHYDNSHWVTDDNHDGFYDMPTYNNLNLANRWFYKNDDYSLVFMLHGIHDDRKAGRREDPHSYLIDLHTDRIDGMMKHGVLLDEESNMSLGIVTSAAYHRQHNTYGPRLWDASQVNAYMNAIFQNTWKGGEILGGGVDNDHQLSAGISVNFDKYWEEQNIGSPRYTDNYYEVTPGIFAEYTYKIADQFSMVAGLRADWSSQHGFFFTPRLNLRYSPFEWWTIRASAGLGYRSPNIIADNAQYLPSNRIWQMEPANKYQEQSLNTGLTTTFDIPIANRTLQITAEYYFTNFMDGMLVDLDRDRHAIYFNMMNQIPDARSFSHSAQIEASMEILNGWNLSAAFRYTDVRQTSFNALAGEYQLREKALQNKYKAVLSTSYQTPKKGWQFDVTAQFNGPARMYDGFVVPDGNSQYTTRHGGTSVYHKWYPQLMAQITKNFKHHVALYVGAENMTNFTQQNPVLGASLFPSTENETMIDPYSADFDASTGWAPTTGWKIYVGLNWYLDRTK
ncbi:MAG: TonB-dependent receptor [Paludibacteraceae bacterium]|nr:TonB-dependent receptor [Paludibacteraceae bacterium]